jgi:hypothetical protein
MADVLRGRLAGNLEGGNANSATRQIQMDPTTHRELIIHGPHAAIHNGRAWYFSDVLTVPAANEYEIFIQTPDTTDWMHFNFALESDAIITSTLFETTTKTYVGGNILTPYNRNRNSSNTVVSGFQMCHTPGGAGDGTEISQHTSGVAGNPLQATGATPTAREELILKQNTAYLINFAGASGDYLSLDIVFYFQANMDDPNY